MEYIDITEYNGEGYKLMVAYGDWRVAVINYHERFDESNFSRMERHRLTDEVFILLSGSARIVIGGNSEKLEELKSYKMEQQKLYNVKRDVWHHIFLERNTCVIVVENDNTCKDNTAYINIKEE